jgi:hypothetical protein
MDALRNHGRDGLGGLYMGLAKAEPALDDLGGSPEGVV